MAFIRPPPFYSADRRSPSPRLPTYNDATADEIEEPPPSYESLFGELKRVRTPLGFLHFLQRLLRILLGSILCTVAIAVVSLIPIAMIVVGALNLKHCPIEKYIPINLIVGGAFGLVKALMSLFSRRKVKSSESVSESVLNDPVDSYQKYKNVYLAAFDYTLNCFLLAWFIAGSVWVFRAQPVFDDSTSELYCDRTTYYLVYSLILASYMYLLLFAMLLLSGLCIACSSCIRGSNNNDEVV